MTPHGRALVERIHELEEALLALHLWAPSGDSYRLLLVAFGGSLVPSSLRHQCDQLTLAHAAAHAALTDKPELTAIPTTEETTHGN